MPDVPPPTERSHYYPLYAYLAALPADQPTVTLTFAAIEALTGRPLPGGAWTRGWWVNAWPVQGWRRAAAAWRAAGWYVAVVHREQLTVTLSREQPEHVRWVRY